MTLLRLVATDLLMIFLIVWKKWNYVVGYYLYTLASPLLLFPIMYLNSKGFPWQIYKKYFKMYRHSKKLNSNLYLKSRKPNSKHRWSKIKRSHYQFLLKIWSKY